MLPVGWMLTVALKPDSVPVFTLPAAVVSDATTGIGQNFPTALTDPRRPFRRYTLNTLMIVAANDHRHRLSCSLVAYAFARLRFRGQRCCSSTS